MRLIEKMNEIWQASRIKAMGIAMASVVLVFGLTSGADALLSLKKVHPGVKVGRVDVGGYSRADAERELKKALEAEIKKPVIVSCKDKKWKLSPEAVGLKIDFAKSVQTAYGVGRTGRADISFGDRVIAWFVGYEVPLSYRIDDKVLSGYLDSVDQQIGLKPKDAAVTLVDEQTQVAKSKDGFAIDRVKAIGDVKNALVSISYRRASLRMIRAEPGVTDKMAEEAAALAAKMISKPVTLGYKEQRWVLEKTDLFALLSFEKSREKTGLYSYKPVINKSKLAEKIDALTTDITIPAKNAKFEASGDSVTIKDGQSGKKINTEEAHALLSNAVLNGERVVYLTMMDYEPDLTTEKAKSYGIERKLGSYTTYYSTSASNRVNNIQLIADAIDGTIIAPNDVFSFNETVGPRTTDKGYLEAPVIVNGRLEQGIGGGICQTATTLFDAAFFAGLDVVQRDNHAFYISRYPSGLDATVSYGGPDLKFRNDTGYHILIKFWYTSESITAVIYGKEELGNEVSYTTSPFTNYTGFATETIKDPNLAKGVQQIEQSGVMGRDVSVHRTVTRKGQVIHEDTFYSHYDPETAIVREGTKDVPPPPPPTPSIPSTGTTQ